jgi:hypothetical protein
MNRYGDTPDMLLFFGSFTSIIGIILLAFGLWLIWSSAAHAQRYDSSYGYEMRGFIPPDPVPRALRDYDNERAKPREPAQHQRRNRLETRR